MVDGDSLAVPAYQWLRSSGRHRDTRGGTDVREAVWQDVCRRLTKLFVMLPFRRLPAQ